MLFTFAANAMNIHFTAVLARFTLLDLFSLIAHQRRSN